MDNGVSGPSTAKSAPSFGKAEAKAGHRSLEGIHSSVEVPHHQASFWLQWVVGMASLMAIFMQVTAARLGVVTGKDLAQCCRDWYPQWTRWPNWLLCELAIGACDLAEVLGSAVALNLMFHIPLFWAVIITGLDVLLLLALQSFGMRTIEAVVVLLIVTIAGCYWLE